tara:strand:+ start:122 stop:316 length:195 start_codon:yes stop_codon:yes gene_type:complete
MTIRKYVLIDRDDQSRDEEYDSFEDAKAVAERTGCAVVERQYEYADSELVWTPDGANTWPPKST